MHQEWEIEYKNMLTAEEFSSLIKAFGISNPSFFKQINDYFDTPQLSLRGKNAALRIRHTGDDKHDLTLKQPQDQAILETHQFLNEDENNLMLTEAVLPKGKVQEQLVKLGIETATLACLGQLETLRAQFPYENGVLFLDHSHYLDRDDYELEFEAADRITGQAVFTALLNHYAIPIRPSKHKIARLYEAMTEQGK